MTKKQFEIIMAEIWDNKYESDKIHLLIDRYTGMSPRELLKKHKDNIYKLKPKDILYKEKYDNNQF